MNAAGHQLLLNCLETLQRALKGEAVNWTETQGRAGQHFLSGFVTFHHLTGETQLYLE